MCAGIPHGLCPAARWPRSPIAPTAGAVGHLKGAPPAKGPHVEVSVRNHRLLMVGGRHAAILPPRTRAVVAAVRDGVGGGGWLLAGREVARAIRDVGNSSYCVVIFCFVAFALMSRMPVYVHSLF